MLTELIAANQEEDENGNGQRRRGLAARGRRGGAGGRARPARGRGGRRARTSTTAPTPAPRAASASAIRRRPARRSPRRGFVEAARTLGILILTHRRLLVAPVQPRPHDRGLRRPLRRRRSCAASAPPRDEPDHDPDVRVVRAPRRRDLARRVPPRDLRRGAHGARREDLARRSAAFHEPLYIGMTATEQLIAKQVSDVFPASVDDLPLAEAARRGLIAPLRSLRVPPVAAINSRADRRRRLRPGSAGAALDHQALNLAAASPLPRPLRQHARHRLRRRRRPRVPPGAGVPRRRDQGGGRLRPHAAGAARRDARGLRARRDQRADQRDAARRRLELAARDRRACTSRRPRRAASTSSGSGGSCACTRARRRASSSTSSPRARRTTSASSRCTPCSTRTSTARARASRLRRGGGSSGARKRKLTPAPWLVPVTPDVRRRLAVIQREWQRVDPKYLDDDEQRFWASIAGRQIRFEERTQFVEKLTAGRATKGALEQFLTTCAAENPNRRLRMMALADRVSMRVERADFDDLVTLVTSAPTWDKDRLARHPRSCCARSARARPTRPTRSSPAGRGGSRGAARKVLDRKAAQEYPEAKRLLGALANSRGHRHEENAAKLVNSALELPKPVGAALLASAEAYTPRANEAARRRARAARADRRGRARARREPAAAEDAALAQAAPPAAEEEAEPTAQQQQAQSQQEQPEPEQAGPKPAGLTTARRALPAPRCPSRARAGSASARPRSRRPRAGSPRLLHLFGPLLELLDVGRVSGSERRPR